MPPRMRLVLAITLVLAALSLAAWLASDSLVARATEREALERYVSDFIVPAEGDSRELPLSTLRLYRYFIEARIDPPLALPGADLEAVEQALGAIDDSLRDTLSFLPGETRELVEESFHPTELLRALAMAERARRAFTGTPSYARAAAYHRALRRAFDVYQSESNRYLAVIAGLERRRGVFFGGETDSEFFAKQLTRAKEQVVALALLEEARYSCLRGMRACPPEARHRMIEEPKEATASRLTEDQQVVRAILDAYVSSRKRRVAYSATDQPQDTIPVVVLESSSCMSGEPPAYKLWWANSRTSGVKAAFTTTVNDLLFYDLATTTGAFYEALRQTGLPYDFQLQNLYLCVDAPRELMDVLTAYRIAHDLVRNPITLTEPSVREGAAVPAELARYLKTQHGLSIEREVLSFHAIARLIAEAEGALRTLGERGLEPYLGSEGVLRLDDLALRWRTKSAYLEHSLGNVDDSLLYLRGVLAHQDIPADGLYLTRSYPSLFFQLGNESVVGTPLSLIEEPRDVPLAQFKLVSYLNGLRQQFTPEELIDYLEIEGKVDESTLPR